MKAKRTGVRSKECTPYAVVLLFTFSCNNQSILRGDGRDEACEAVDAWTMGSRVAGLVS